MSASPAMSPAGPSPRRTPDVRPESPARLAWLETELARWQDEGLLDGPGADAIRARYVAHRRLTLTRIVLTLGAGFLGLGLIWLVAANLDGMSPLTRFVLVAAVWLALVAAGEALAGRRDHGVASPVVAVVRLLAVAAYGAVVFQAAQSLQVPADEPRLVGLWALGALAHGYAVRAADAVVVGILLAAGWVVWHVGSTSASLPTAVLTVAAAGLVLVTVGLLHGRAPSGSPTAGLGTPWREVGAVLALGSLFTAALPFGDEAPSARPLLLGLVGIGGVLAMVVAATGDVTDRLEAGLAVATLLLVLVLLLWMPTTGLTASGAPSGADLARAVCAVLAFLAVASGYALLGGRRDSGRLTWVATLALVVFTTTQAFAVFAPILSGAVLFLAVGLVLLVTGYGADRARRRIVREGRRA